MIKLLMLFFILINVFACGRISLTGVHPVASSVVDDGKIYGPNGSVIGDEDVGLYSSIALDESDIPLIAYYDATNTRLKFANWDDREGKWKIEVVDNTDDVGAYTSLTVIKGKPFISYYDRTNGNLKLAFRVMDLWKTFTVDQGGPANYDVGKYTSISSAPEGRVCISYYDSSNGDLMLACWDGMSYDENGTPAFTIESVDAYADPTGGETGMYTSLKINPSGQEFIAYYDASHGDPKLAIRTESGWRKLTVGSKLKGIVLNPDPVTHKAFLSPPSTFVYSEITVFKNGVAMEPEIGYTLDAPNEITIIDYDPTAAYTADYVTSPDDDGTWIKLALRSDDTPVVAFHNRTAGTLTYAELDMSNIEWHLQTVDAGNVGTDISLTLSANDDPVITYFDNAYMDLKLAYRRNGFWNVDTIGTTGISGLWSSCILDSSGILHISYYQTREPNAGDLLYAKFTLSR